jgi:hypothetical protein
MIASENHNAGAVRPTPILVQYVKCMLFNFSTNPERTEILSCAQGTPGAALPVLVQQSNSRKAAQFHACNLALDPTQPKAPQLTPGPCQMPFRANDIHSTTTPTTAANWHSRYDTAGGVAGKKGCI